MSAAAAKPRGFGRGRGKRTLAVPPAGGLFATPPQLSQSDLSNNLAQISNIAPYSSPPTYSSPAKTSYSSPAKASYSSPPRDSYFTTPALTDSSSGPDTIMVPINLIGRIIGSRGATINQIQDETGARVDIAKEECGSEKEVSISGSRDSIDRAKNMIADILEGGGGGAPPSRGGYTNGSSGGDDVMVFKVAENQVGRIIGRSGCTINSIRDETGVQIDIGKECVDGNLKEVTLGGSAEGRAKARELIEEQVNIIDEAEQARKAGMVDYNRPIDWGAVAAGEAAYQHEKWGSLPPVEKEFYVEDPAVSRLSAGEVAQIRAENMAIEVSHYVREKDQDNPPVLAPISKPILTFEHAFQRYPDILREIYKQGFKEPSPIQKQMWPVLLSGHDCIGVAQTGTGKTLAFLLPAFIHIEAQPKPRSERKGPTVFCLAPTRELALQIKWEVDKYSYHGISSACVYGGASRHEQVRQVKAGVDIVVATPGRLNDLIESNLLNLDECSYLILDEADRMLDMGFEPQIKKTLLDIRPDRHTIMTSATWPPGVRRIAHEYMNNSIIVNVGTLDLKAACTVTQQIIMTTLEDKMKTLTDILETEMDHRRDKALVFVGRKITADFISSEFITRYMQPELAHLHIKSDAIHGDRDQSDREAALGGFKDGDISVLIATDVASRGLDVPDISHVINYDFPRDMEDYVHRVGRTGRAGRTGTAVSLFTREDWRKAGDLIQILSDSQQHVPDELVTMAERWARKKEQMEREKGSGNGRGGGGGPRQRYR